MIRRILILTVLLLLAFALLPLFTGSETPESVGALAEEYLTTAPAETGAGNVVTSVVVTYRGLDTLGEVAVLFLAASGTGLLIGRLSGGVETGGHTGDHEKVDAANEGSEILQTAGSFLMPMLVLFGTYIFIHGHVTPGGGFQGGVVIASAFLLTFLAHPTGHVRHGLLSLVESLSGASYVVLGLLGLVLGAGFLDNRILPLGEVGSLLSAGAIPIIYSLIGLKVGSELTGILDSMRRTR